MITPLRESCRKAAIMKENCEFDRKHEWTWTNEQICGWRM